MINHFKTQQPYTFPKIFLVLVYIIEFIMICMIWSENSSSHSNHFCGVTMFASTTTIAFILSTIFKCKTDRLFNWKNLVRALFGITFLFRSISFILIQVYNSNQSQQCYIDLTTLYCLVRFCILSLLVYIVLLWQSEKIHKGQSGAGVRIGDY